MAKASIKDMKAFFESDGGRKITLPELKELKESRGGDDFSDIANGIGDSSLTY